MVYQKHFNKAIYNGYRAVQGDTIEVVCNRAEGTVKFYVNGNIQGENEGPFVCDEMKDINCKLRFSVCLYEHLDSVEIIDPEQ